MGGSKQKVSTWGWGFGCREATIGCQERLRDHCPETSLDRAGAVTRMSGP